MDSPNTKISRGNRSLVFVRTFLLNALYHVKVQMKIRDSRLQNGKVAYKWGISFTKQESHLQSGTLGVQTGLSACYLPEENYRCLGER